MALGLTEHEAVAAIQSASEAGGSQKTGKRTYELHSKDRLIAGVKLNAEGDISFLDVAADVWDRIFPTIQADCAIQRYGIARSIVFSSRPIRGFAMAPAWLQIRPVALALGDARWSKDVIAPGDVGAPFPIVTEVMFRRSDLIFLDSHRRIRSVQESHWLLATFIDVPIFGICGAFSWALLEGRYQLVTLGMATGLEAETEDAFSPTMGIPQLPPVPFERYYTQLGIGEPQIRVPDLEDLYARYSSLDHQRRVRFLRASASLWAAHQPGVTQSQRLVSLVSAIDPLLEPPRRCAACGSTVGITESFRRFLAAYVNPPPEIAELYEAVYASRSRIVHGGWNFEVDEPFMAIANEGYLTSLAAWGAAKRGVINWLLAQQ